MSKPKPVPPGHQTYPRGAVEPREAPKAPDSSDQRAPWTRAVPEQRTFPRR